MVRQCGRMSHARAGHKWMSQSGSRRTGPASTAPGTASVTSLQTPFRRPPVPPPTPPPIITYSTGCPQISRTPRAGGCSVFWVGQQAKVSLSCPSMVRQCGRMSHAWLGHAGSCMDGLGGLGGLMAGGSGLTARGTADESFMIPVRLGRYFLAWYFLACIAGLAGS